MEEGGGRGDRTGDGAWQEACQDPSEDICHDSGWAARPGPLGTHGQQLGPFCFPQGRPARQPGRAGSHREWQPLPRDPERAGTPRPGGGATAASFRRVCPEASLGSGEPENFHTQRPRQLAECGDAGLGGPGLAGARRLHLGQCFPNPPHGRPREPVSLGQARPGLLASGCSEWHAWKTLPKHGSGQVRAYDVWTLHCPVTFLSPPAPPSCSV